MDYGPLLIVEDSDEDFYAMRRALGTTLPCGVVRCRTGSEALDYLFRRGLYTQAALPSLVLLDLNLPGKDGRTVLEQVKRDATLRAVPVVVVSTSDNPADIARCYSIGCSGYLVKALAYERLATALQVLGAYWFTVVTLPHS
ncbi:MAG TPA: response regulator [Candidatus Binatia bacterium]|nr:response regulator [Candidatus Binatia bacterium]